MQVHYPFENASGFLENRFPADFIAEGLDQVSLYDSYLKLYYDCLVRLSRQLCIISFAHSSAC